MPTYEYKCTTCGKEFEYLQRITDEPLKNCPNEICENEIKGKGFVERKISKNIGLVFNGKGFYLTDYVHKNTSSSSTSNSGTKSTKESVSKVSAPKTETTKSATETK